jgi:hypothetical protein
MAEFVGIKAKAATVRAGTTPPTDQDTARGCPRHPRRPRLNAGLPDLGQ